MDFDSLMSDFIRAVNNNYKFIVTIFFILYLLLGLSIYKDYGIHTDQKHNRDFGLATWEYINKGNKGAYVFEYSHGKTHGPAFELLLIFIEKGLNLKDSRDITLMRHLTTFLLFYLGVFFFYLLCNKHFKSWKLGLLGSIFLVLSPRIFAHSFYNSVDIAVLVFFIISAYTMINFLEKKSISSAIIHALTSAILTDIRNFGIFVPCLTFLFISIDLFKSKYKKPDFRKIMAPLTTYILLVTLFIILFWPYLWEDPVVRFLGSFQETTQGIVNISLMYMGKSVMANDVPWHFNFVWMAITIPPLHILLFLIGLTAIIFKVPKLTSVQLRNYIFVLWFFVPLIAPILLKSALFLGWRHHYFVYPAFLFISLTGLSVLFNLIEKISTISLRKKIKLFLIFVILVCLLSTISTMMRIHPYQDVYYNPLVGGNIGSTKGKFFPDSWGLSHKEALEYILKKDHRDDIKYYSIQYPSGIRNLDILLPFDRKRIQHVDNYLEADYFMTNCFESEVRYPFENEIYSISIDGLKIRCVYIKNVK